MKISNRDGAPPSKLAEAISRNRLGHRLTPEETETVLPLLISKLPDAEFISAHPLVGLHEMAEFHIVVHLPYADL